VTQNNQPTPMYIMARLNLDAQCISVSNEYADLRLESTPRHLRQRWKRRKRPVSRSRPR
jgi:nitrate/nitrite transport system substrate-binding protein